MTQPTYGKIYPFEGSNEAGDAEWRKLAGAYGDGIINDVSGLSFSVVPSATDRTITVRLHECRIRGIDFEAIPVSGADPTTVITLSSPSAGQTRCDRIIAQYDPSVPSISIIKNEGSPVSSGIAQPAALARTAGGTWDLALWQFTGGNVVASQLVKLDERTWVGAWFMVPTAAALSDQHASAPIGSHAYVLDSGHHCIRKMVSGAPAWVDEDDPGFTAFPTAGGAGALVGPSGGAQPLYGKANGKVKCRGQVLRSSGLPLITPGADTNLGTLPIGFRPNSDRWFVLPEVGGNSFVRCQVGAGGLVVCKGTAAGVNVHSVALDPIDFYAEQ